MANEQKQKNCICHDFNTLGCLSNFLHIKNKQIWTATVNYQKVAISLKGKMPTKANLKRQIRLRENKGKFAYRICKF